MGTTDKKEPYKTYLVYSKSTETLRSQIDGLIVIELELKSSL